MYYLIPYLTAIGFLLCHPDPSPLSAQETASGIHSYLGAREIARDQEKEILAWFGAEWCTACLEIRKDWLPDTSRTASPGATYIQAWIDIDDFDGYVLKDQYRIDRLPTVLILSPEGRVLARKQDAWTREAFFSWLKQHRMNAKPTTGSVHSEADSKRERKTPKNGATSVLEDRFRVQLGAFSSKDGAKRRAEEIETKTGLQIDVREIIRNEGRIYKLFSAPFEQESVAKEARDKLQSYGIDCFVRTLKGTKNI